MDDAPPPPLEGAPDPNGADCVDCGRCCHHGPRTVHLLEDDELAQEILDEFLVFAEEAGDEGGGET